MQAVSDQRFPKRRRYPRVRVPNGMFFGWKAPGHRTVSHAQEIGLGGVFIVTPKAPHIDEMIDLIFDCAGGEVRARAIVRSLRPGLGMGLEFVQMTQEHRGRLNQFLASQIHASATVSGAETFDVASAPGVGPTGQNSFERELAQLLGLAQKGNYYKLLGVAAGAPADQVKKNFYSLARKFHPDHHMDRAELSGPLHELMEALTLAYHTLVDDARREAYDRRLAISGAFKFRRVRANAPESLETCLANANERIRAQNFAGSIVWLRKCVDLAPTDARFHAMLARSLGTVAQYRDEAVEHFQQAIELDPLNVNILFLFANLCEEMMNFGQARALYLRILELDPAHAKSQDRLAALPVPAVR
jgi:hypothetical protein